MNNSSNNSHNSSLVNANNSINANIIIQNFPNTMNLFNDEETPSHSNYQYSNTPQSAKLHHNLSKSTSVTRGAKNSYGANSLTKLM
jgi:hypothetical protein